MHSGLETLPVWLHAGPQWTNPDNPSGTYAGAILRIDGAGRNLTEFDALTFYVKALKTMLKI